MQIRIHELAAKEFDEAIEWYELQSRGLGKRFKHTVIEQMNQIKKFPYKLLFTIDDNNNIIIWAIAHMHRKPWYWQSRMSQP
jgi:hypothetical protein